MKKEFFLEPAGLNGREMYGFSWLEHVTAIPSPLLVVTTYKDNGKTNATMQSWTTFTNDNGVFYCIFASVNKGGHMYKSIKQTNSLVINFPDKDNFLKCHATIANNGYDNDEIELSGLTAERASTVNAPRIKECFLNLECEYAWEKETYEGSGGVVMCVKVVNAVMDEEHYNAQKLGRYGDTGYLYNIHSPMNPESFKEEDTYVGVIRKLATYDELNR